MNRWTFETKVILARKTPVHGLPYTGVLTITRVNNETHIEGLHCDEFTREDHKEILRYLKDTFGTSKYVSKRGHSVVAPLPTSNLNKGNTND